jgi:hypothetical protein
MKLDRNNESKIILNTPFVVSMGAAAKFVQPIPNFLAYFVPLDVDVTGSINAKICAARSEVTSTSSGTK